MSLDQYEKWVGVTDIKDMIYRFNPTTISPIEISLIRESMPNKLCDIGCLNGSRLFPFLDKEGIEYVGIEKFQKLAEGDDKKYLKKIVVEDILNVASPQYSILLKDIDTITIFEGSLYGIFSYEGQEVAWKNIKSLLCNNEGTVIYDSLIIDGYFDYDEIGAVQYKEYLPPQYHLTEKQLYKLWNAVGFRVDKCIDYESSKQEFGTRRYYVLKIN